MACSTPNAGEAAGGHTEGDLVARILGQDPFPLKTCSKIFAEFRGGQRPHPSTIARWVQRGLKLPDGGIVRLGAIRCGGLWLTSRVQIEEFIRAQQPGTVVPAEEVRSRSARSRAAARAVLELKRANAL